MRGCDVCEKCKPIDADLERYRRLKARLTDRKTLEGIARLMDELERQKKALHPE
jgi:hypothetical protein